MITTHTDRWTGKPIPDPKAAPLVFQMSERGDPTRWEWRRAWRQLITLDDDDDIITRTVDAKAQAVVEGRTPHPWLIRWRVDFTL